MNVSHIAAFTALLNADELAGLNNQLIEVEGRLHAAVEHWDALAHSASRHLVQAGGKRVRPILTLLAAHLGDPTRDEVLQAAVAVELTHLATLYHDDVMDSAPTRRGAPTAQTVWGNSVAIITGDLLFARASRLISELGPEAVLIQSMTFERLCLGQLHETVGVKQGEDQIEHYLQVLADKTGSLIATSGRYGTMFAGCDDTTVEILAQYGEKVGVAFQLADDVIDLLGDPATGKHPGTDLREGVPTMPVLQARRLAAEGDATAQRVVDLVDSDLSDDTDLDRAVQAVRDCESTEHTRALAKQWSREAVELIEPLPDGAVKDALVSFALSVADRSA